MDNNKYNCPKCGSENTSAVSLVYKNGHTTGHATNKELVGYTDVKTEVTVHSDGSTSTKTSGGDAIYGNVTRPTESYSDLARTVPPPTEPQFQEIKSGGSGCIGCIGFVVGLAIVQYVLSLAENIVAIKNLETIIFNWLNAECGKIFGTLLWIAICFVIFFLGALSIVAFFANLYDKFFTWKHNSENQRLREEYEKDMAIYRQERWNWEHTYICMRCGEKFIVED